MSIAHRNQAVAAACRAALGEGRTLTRPLEVLRYACQASHRERAEHHFAFCKPEVLATDALLPPTKSVDLICHMLAEQGVEIVGAHLLPGRWLQHTQFIAQYYWVLSEVARCGVDCSAGLQNHFHRFDPHSRIMGSKQVLQSFQALTARELQAYGDRVGNVKIEPGVYAATLTLGDERITVLNSFYPEQEQRWQSKASHILALVLSSQRSLREIRAVLVGSTDPRVAPLGSIRRTLHDLHACDVDEAEAIKKNGFHVAPNAIDSFRGIWLLCSLQSQRVSPQHLQFGSKLVHALGDEASGLLVDLLQARPKLEEMRFTLHRMTEDLGQQDVIDRMSDVFDGHPSWKW